MALEGQSCGDAQVLEGLQAISLIFAEAATTARAMESLLR